MHTESTYVPQEVSSDEKLLALLSYLSIFLGGILLPIIIWATQRDKSKFVRFHSLQAIFFHIAFVVIIIAFVFIVIIIFVGSGIGLGIFDDTSYRRNESMPAVMIIMMIVLYGGIFLVIFSGIGYAIYLAVKSFKGFLVKIPIIGNIIYKRVYGQS